jgi:hypothetical protein
LPSSVLLLPAELEGGHTQVGEGERERGFRSLGLGGTAQELAADALELLADIQLGGVEADHFPGKAEQLTLAQAQNQEQDVSGVKPVTRDTHHRLPISGLPGLLGGRVPNGPA